jgi:hypothetical protein
LHCFRFVFVCCILATGQLTLALSALFCPWTSASIFQSNFPTKTRLESRTHLNFDNFPPWKNQGFWTVPQASRRELAQNWALEAPLEEAEMTSIGRICLSSLVKLRRKNKGRYWHYDTCVFL